MTVRKPAKPAREPRPLAAFFISLAVSALLLGGLLASDRRVIELRKAKVELKELDLKIAEARAENSRLNSAIEAANREEFPAEKVAREELNLVHPEDLVLLYPPGSLSGEKPTPSATRSPRVTATAPPAAAH
ncbi:MAG TPA: septum formation initiator family protein [Thermoanaerobaculia bacterium]|nr:septum formation initiator family protein [Thermoanaerobaculia bacterium]